MLKPIGRDNSMLQRERQTIVMGAKPKSKPHSWCKKLLIGTIITSLAITAILPSSAFAKAKKSNRAVKSQTIAMATDGGKNDDVKNENKIVSAEKTIICNGNKYCIKLETNDNSTEIKTYADSAYFDSFDISQTIGDNFSGKFTNREIIMGNPSFIVKGIDGKGNYAYLLFSGVQGRVHTTPITSGFNAEILKKLGVEPKCIFDENTKTCRISYQKDREEVAFVDFSEDGKDLKRNTNEDFWKLYYLTEQREKKQ